MPAFRMKYLPWLLLLLVGCPLLTAAAQPAQWTFRAPLQTPRTGLAAAVLDGHIYVLGGRDGLGNVLDLATRYDPKTNRWDVLPPLRTARVNAAAVALQGRIYVLGGRDRDGQVLDAVEFYDPAEDRWASFEDMEGEREGLVATVRNDKIYVAGGSNGKEEILDSIAFYDPAQEQWVEFDGQNDQPGGEEVELTGTIEALDATSITVDGVRFLVTAATEVLDEDGDPIPFGDLAVGMTVEVRGERDAMDVLFATRIRIRDRGDDGLGELEFCQADIDLNTGDTFNVRDYVREKDDPATPVDWAQVFFTYTDAGANDPTNPPDWNLDAFNNGQPVTVTAADAAPGTGNRGDGRYRLYVVRLGQPAFDDHATFRIDDDRDSEVESAKCAQGGGRAAGKHTDAGLLGVPRASFAAVQVGDSVLFIGGFSRFGPLDLVQRLRPDGSFDFLPPLPVSRGSLAAAAVHDTLYVAGGRDAGDQVLATVQMLVPGAPQWRSMPPLNVAREGAAAAAVDGVVYVVGGRSASGKVLDSVEAFGDLRTALDQPPAPPDFRLAQNYPNPFRLSTTIAFSVSARGAARRVLLAVYDVQGRRVATLVDGVLPAGEHRVTWDGAGHGGAPLGSGIYVYRLQQGHFVARNVMALVH